MNFDLTTFDASKALTLRQAIDTGRLTFRGRKPTLLLVQRWSNPRIGCKPLGPGGPCLVLPAIITGREKLTMPEWIDWFVRERSTLMIDAAKRLVVPVSQAKLEERAEKAKQRMRKVGVNC